MSKHKKTAGHFERVFIRQPQSDRMNVLMWVYFSGPADKALEFSRECEAILADLKRRYNQ